LWVNRLGNFEPLNEIRI